MSYTKIVSAFVGLLLAVTLFIGYNSTLKEGNRLENGLLAQFSNAQISLSTDVNTVYEQLGIGDRKSKKFTTALRDYVGGRNLANGSPAAERQAFINAVTEAVPNLGSGGFDLYDKIADRAYALRQSFQNEQKGVQDQARNFRIWLHDGVFRKLFVAMVGFPDQQLVAKNAQGVSVYGSEALRIIETPIISLEAQNAFQSGIDKAILPGKE